MTRTPVYTVFVFISPLDAYGLMFADDCWAHINELLIRAERPLLLDWSSEAHTQVEAVQMANHQGKIMVALSTCMEVEKDVDNCKPRTLSNR